MADTRTRGKPINPLEAVKRKRGRPSVYTERAARLILDALADGKSLRSICEGPGMPPCSTVREWVRDDREGFATRYARAREIGYELLADELLDIADDSTGDKYLDADGVTRTDHEAIQRSRLRVDARKWMLAKMLPKRYGDKLDTAQSGEVTIRVIRTRRGIDGSDRPEDEPC
jgi:hypothetical protein